MNPVLSASVLASALFLASGKSEFLSIVNKAKGEISVLNLQDHTSQVFKAGYLPHETAVAQGLVFVSNYGSAHIRSSALTNDPGNTLSVIDLSQPQESPKILELGPGRCGPHGFAVSTDQRRLYVTCEIRQEILVVDVSSQKVIEALPTNQAGSHMVVLSADGSKAYVANFYHGTVSVLDLRTKKILAQILTAKGSEGIGISPKDDYVYTVSPLSNELVKIDAHTFKEVARKVLGENKGTLRVVPTPDSGKDLIINCSTSGTTLIVDADTLEIRHEVKVGKNPIGISVPNSTYAYVANMVDNTISVLNIQKGVVEATLPAGEVPDGIFYFTK
jgi:YVTN family beta-propeller protein